MDVREKFVELLITADDYEDRVCKGYPCRTCPYDGTDCSYRAKADHLIAHGVTVQEWISVKEHLPQENEPEGATCEQVQVLLENGVVSTGWCNRHTKLWWHLNYGETHFVGYDYEHTPIVAWQPLAQPPKGE